MQLMWHEGDSQENHYDADSFTECHPLSEYCYSEKYGCYRFKCSKNGGGSGPYVLDGAGRAQKRDGCRKDCERNQVGPHIPAGRYGQFSPGQQADYEQGHAEYQYVESDGKSSGILQSCLVDTYYIYGVRESGCQGQNRAGKAEGGSVWAFVQHGYSAQCHQHADAGLKGDFFLEREGHNHCYHDRVDEKYGRRYAGFHEIVALKEGERGYGHQESHDYESESLLAVDPEGASAGMNHDGQDGNGPDSFRR